MQITLKPLHLGFIGFAAGGIIVILVVLILAGSGDDPGSEATVLGATAVAPTATLPVPTATSPASTAPEPEPTSTKAAPTATKPAPTSTRPPVPTSTPAGPAPPVATTPPNAQEETEAERRYRVQAQVQIVSAVVKVNQAANNLSLGTVGRHLAFGVAGATWANQMAGLEPAPPRFRQVHDELRAALYAAFEYSKTATSVFDDASYAAWWPGYLAVQDPLEFAYDNYRFVVGLTLPELPRFTNPATSQ